MKTCPSCKKTKKAEEYGSYGNPAKMQGYCNECRNKKRRMSYKQNQEKEKNKAREYARKNKIPRILKTYNINEKEYGKLIAESGGKCQICKKDFSSSKFMHIDHDHSTNTVRGLLCNNCNTGLGQFKDSKDILLLAIEYLSGQK